MRSYDVTDDEFETWDEKQNKRHRLVWLVTAIAMGIAGVFVFILTQDMTAQIVLVNVWSIVNAVILAVEILAVMFVFKCANLLCS
jgi:TM2 domain-containing membrane protein YozV